VSDVSYPLRRRSATTGTAYYLRVLRVIGAIDFKARYADAVLGYVWSLIKPLAYFGVLWLVFAYLLRTANQTHNFAIFLLIGILLYTFFVDSVTVMLPSIVHGGAILRRLSFPPILIPLAASVSVFFTFCVNLLALFIFIAFDGVTPRIEWLLVVPLLLELYIFSVSVGLLVAALYVRFRDIGQVWELASQLLFFACAIFYPIGILPVWAQRVAFVNPFVQVMQDVRHIVLGGPSGPNDVTAATVYASMGGRLIPIAVVGVLSLGALLLFQRDGRYFAERI
jgi:ABC-2 type transport system permease protein